MQRKFLTGENVYDSYLGRRPPHHPYFLMLVQLVITTVMSLFTTLLCL